MKQSIAFSHCEEATRLYPYDWKLKRLGFNISGMFFIEHVQVQDYVVKVANIEFHTVQCEHCGAGKVEETKSCAE